MHSALAGTALVGTMCLGGVVVAAQTAESVAGVQSIWIGEASVSGAVDTGVGSSHSAPGVSGSLSLLRLTLQDRSRPQHAMGAIGTFMQLWPGAFSGGVEHTEQWLLAGPRFDAYNDEDGFASLRPVLGVKHGMSTSFAAGVSLAISLAAAQAGSHPTYLRAVDIGYVVSPGESGARHHLTVSVGVDVRLGASP